MSTKQANIYKGYLPFQSEFSHRPEKCLIAGYKKPISTFCSEFEPKENVNEH